MIHSIICICMCQAFRNDGFVDLVRWCRACLVFRSFPRCWCSRQLAFCISDKLICRTFFFTKYEIYYLEKIFFWMVKFKWDMKKEKTSQIYIQQQQQQLRGKRNNDDFFSLSENKKRKLFHYYLLQWILEKKKIKLYLWNVVVFILI